MAYITIYLFLHKIFRNFRNTKEKIDWPVVFFTEKSFFLKSEVISASLKLLRKLPVIKNSLKRF